MTKFEIFSSSNVSDDKNSDDKKSDNTPSTSVVDENVTTPMDRDIENSELALLNMIGSMWASIIWCQQNKHQIDENGWKPHSSVPAAFVNLLKGYKSYKDLIDNFPENNLKIAVSNKPEEAAQKANQWGTRNRFTADLDAMKQAGVGNALYSVVHLDLQSTWKGIVCQENNGVIQLDKGASCKMGQDIDGNPWGSYKPSDAPVDLEVRVTYLTGKMNFGELLLAHSKPETLEPYNQTGMLSMFTSSQPNPMEQYQGFRFIHIKRDLSTVGMRPLLGCENGIHQFNGIQAKGIMNINGKGTRLSVTSVAVDRMRGGGHSEVPEGYLNFYTEVDTGGWTPDRKFNCLFEFLVDNKLVYATICNENHSRGADSGDRGGYY